MKPLASLLRCAPAALGLLGWLLTTVSGPCHNRCQAQVAGWSDERLEVRDGLRLWLDASRLNAARQQQGLPPLESGAAVETWYDASRPGRAVTQIAEQGRPKLVQVGKSWVLRFDGEDDCFRLIDTGETLHAASIFIVAAPHANPGEFRGLLAANAPQSRDYESGFTIDLGAGPTRSFDQVNVEGRGFGGAYDLLMKSFTFGTLHVLESVIDPAGGQVRFALDGNRQADRGFAPQELSFDQVTVGARFYTNSADPQQTRGYFVGDIAELLVFDRVLDETQTASVRAYLTKKHADLADELPKTLNLGLPEGISLVMAKDPPAVQMLQPGFTVRELPLELTNVNNVRYREDGKLVTLGYNGDIHLLSDTNGDGLEDRAELFWKNEGSIRGPIGITLTPPGYAKGRGVFVPSKGKVSLIVDTNGDDKADEEIIVAQGWKEIAQSVDAVGIAMAADGSLYFGLGTTNFANAYLVDESGKASYDIASDRGTVQRVSPDFSERTTICTGVRFPISFAFNRAGDLFCTDQEGATWLSNGNPFDELLHIQPERHYGFPPRHPRHNPGVIDEPSTFDYGPQHQSTCGFIFNEPVHGGPAFGPAAWAGDAIVCGESRGKLWRTKLVRSDAGYVAATQLFACLQMLTVDACVAPNGDLIVACHSGPPDWGTGPAGAGKLFRISMTEPEAPRPVLSWAEGPQEIRLAFDRPLSPEAVRDLAKKVRVEYGQHVRAGDRFENLIPPYAVVQAQLSQPRYELPVHGATITADRRTMLLHTSPLRANMHYAVTISAGDEPRAEGEPLAQFPQVDVDFGVHGVQAEWTPAGSDTPAWSGWLPHVDLDVSQALLADSAGHAPLWAALETPGRLALKTRLDVHHLLRPAVQPGSTIDYEWPDETVIVTIACHNGELTAQAEQAGAPPVAILAANSSGRQQVLAMASGDARGWLDLDVAVVTGGTRPVLSIHAHTSEDGKPRPLPLRRFLPPWLQPASAESAATGPVKIAALEGGSWVRGRRVFQSEAASCSKCHAIGGRGATIGPDLMNLVHRDYHSVLRDISQPSFAINPDYIGHSVVLNDGRVLVGVLQSDGDHLLLGDEKGQVTRLKRDEIDTLQASPTSIMPKGIVEKLTPDQLRDLLTYLLTPPPQMPLDSPLPPPPPRTQAEVTAALAGSPEGPVSYRPLQIVLVDGPKDHGPGEHDYPAWKLAWQELMSAADNVTVSTAREFPSDEQLAVADVLIFFQHGSFGGERPAKLDAYLARGGGAVYIHWAVNGDEEARAFSQRIGYASRGGRIRYRHGPLLLDMHNQQHPIVRNIQQLQLYDESYWQLTGEPSDVTLLATSSEDGAPTPQMWTTEKGKGRVFVSIPGHYNWTFDDPLFRIVLLRGIAWSAHEPVDRFNELVTIGARLVR